MFRPEHARVWPRGSLGAVRLAMVARHFSRGAGPHGCETPGMQHSPAAPRQSAAGGPYTSESGPSGPGTGEPESEPHSAEDRADGADCSGASAAAAAPEPPGAVGGHSSSTASASATAGASPGTRPAAPGMPSAGGPSPVFGHGYAVWHIPGRPELVGVHMGGHRAWQFIESTLPNRRYGASGARLRRAESQVQAIALYRGEARAHRVRLEPAVSLH